MNKIIGETLNRNTSLIRTSFPVKMMAKDMDERDNIDGGIYLSEPWLLTLPGSRGGPGPRCARAWGPQGAASFPAAAGSWHRLPPIRGPSRRSPVIPARPPTSTWSCPSAALRLPRSIRTSVALQFRKTHQSRHSTRISPFLSFSLFSLFNRGK